MEVMRTILRTGARSQGRGEEAEQGSYLGNYLIGCSFSGCLIWESWLFVIGCPWVLPS